jgi:hypothetical protein
MKLIIIIVIAATILAVSGTVLVSVYRELSPIACTMEAMLCPDGSYVGRTGPNCQFAPCPAATKTPDSWFSTSGTIMGHVSIGPLCPVEPCPGKTPDVYSSHQIVLTPTGGGRPIDLPIYIKINSDGTFRAEVPESNYELTITNCTYLGCRYELPKLIRIEANQTLNVDINIDTGIR